MDKLDNCGAAALPSWIERLFRMFIGAIFGLAAVSKIVGFRGFGVTVRFLIPLEWLFPYGVVAVAVLIIALEAYIAVWLLTTAAESRHLLLASVMLVAFTMALVRIWQTPLAPDCNCLTLLKVAKGANDSVGDGIVRNSAFLVILGWLQWREKQRRLAPAQVAPPCGAARGSVIAGLGGGS